MPSSIYALNHYELVQLPCAIWTQCNAAIALCNWDFVMAIGLVVSRYLVLCICEKSHDLVTIYGRYSLVQFSIKNWRNSLVQFEHCLASRNLVLFIGLITSRDLRIMVGECVVQIANASEACTI